MVFNLWFGWLMVAMVFTYCGPLECLPAAGSSTFSSSDPLDFTDCGSLYYVDNLMIEGCTSSVECELYIGRNKSITFEVRTGTRTNELASDVYLYARGMKWSLAVSPKSPCDIIGCPVTETLTTMYSATIFVDETFLQLRGDLYWLLHGDQSLQLVCFSTPVVILFDPDVKKDTGEDDDPLWRHSWRDSRKPLFDISSRTKLSQNSDNLPLENEHL